jgi:hypothetical protein
VTSAKILDGTVDTVDFADDAVTSDKIADDAIGADNIGTGAVTTDEILDSTIVDADVSAIAAIAWSKMAALTSAHILVGDAGNVAADVAVSGDISLANDGTATIVTDAVTSAKILDGTIVVDDIATGAVTSGGILDGTITDTDLAVKYDSGTMLVPNTGAPTPVVFTAGFTAPPAVVATAQAFDLNGIVSVSGITPTGCNIHIIGSTVGANVLVGWVAVGP